MVTPIIHILGPGGAGKSTAGALLAESLGWTFIDLDRYFLEHSGNIAGFIKNRGYAAYAQQNVSNYTAATLECSKPVVVVLSSGFMTYARETAPRYEEIRCAIEKHPFSILLLPSFDLEECVKIIVERQLNRTSLAADKSREEERIRARFPVFMSLCCNRFLSKKNPVQVVAELASFFTGQRRLLP